MSGIEIFLVILLVIYILLLNKVNGFYRRISISLCYLLIFVIFLFFYDVKLIYVGVAIFVYDIVMLMLKEQRDV